MRPPEFIRGALARVLGDGRDQFCLCGARSQANMNPCTILLSRAPRGVLSGGAARGGASREPAADRPAEIRHAVKHACTKSHALRTSTAILRGALRPQLRVQDERERKGGARRCVCVAACGGAGCVQSWQLGLSSREPPLAISFPSNGPTECVEHSSAMVWVEHRPAKRNCPHSQGGQVRSRRWRKKSASRRRKEALRAQS
jgi:hypothetical protein